MSRIEQLIAELCPDGVECQMLVDVAKILYGFPFQSNMFTDDEKYIPLIRIRDIKQGKGSIYFKGSFSSEFIIKRGDMIVGMDGEFNLNKWNDRDSILNQRVCKIESKNENITNNNYLFHLLIPLFKKIESETSGSTVKHLSAKAINNISIPIPPLPIQQEIVRILDTFTDLDAELQAELEARKKQYEHYRNQLLNFEGKEVEWIPFEDCFEMKNGYTPSKSKSEYWNNGTIPWFRMEDIRSNGKILSNSIQKINQEAIKGGKLFPANSIIIATSATIGEHALITTEYLSNQRFTCYYPKKAYKEKVNMKYMYYYSYLLSEWCKNNTNVSGFASVDMTRFRKLQIPLPPVSEQERIVSILDKFEALVNEELSAEIDARRKQYEYYREKLLAFEPLVS